MDIHNSKIRLNKYSSKSKWDRKQNLEYKNKIKAKRSDIRAGRRFKDNTRLDQEEQEKQEAQNNKVQNNENNSNVLFDRGDDGWVLRFLLRHNMSDSAVHTPEKVPPRIIINARQMKIDAKIRLNKYSSKSKWDRKQNLEYKNKIKAKRSNIRAGRRFKDNTRLDQEEQENTCKYNKGMNSVDAYYSKLWIEDWNNMQPLSFHQWMNLYVNDVDWVHYSSSLDDEIYSNHNEN